jgi:branched-chain amino acid aminotransferase
MPVFFNYNSRLLEAGTTILSPESRAVRYGDGIFETIRMHQGKMPLWDLHFARLTRGLEALKFSLPTHLGKDQFQAEILKLAERNRHLPHARIRLTLFRGDGGLYDPVSPIAHYTIQSWSLPEHYRTINENGLALCVFDQHRKMADELARHKTNNALLYVLAALHAKEEKCNEALVLNHRGNIADASIANLFWIEGEQVYTTPLEDGPVAGVMRETLLEIAKNSGRPILEKSVDPASLESVDSIFLTNALYGMRWVGTFGAKSFQPGTPMALYREWISPIFP